MAQSLQNTTFIAHNTASYVNMMQLYAMPFILTEVPHIHNILPSSLIFNHATLTLAATAHSAPPVYNSTYRLNTQTPTRSNPTKYLKETNNKNVCNLLQTVL